MKQVNSRECYETLWDPWGDDVETEYLRMTAELAHDRSSSWWIAYVCIYVCTYVRVVPYVCSPWREYNCLFSEFSTHLGFFGTLPDKLQSLSRSGRRSVCRPQLARLVAEVSVILALMDNEHNAHNHFTSAIKPVIHPAHAALAQ